MIKPVTNRSTIDIRRQNDLSRDIARLQVEVSTGKKLLAPSDDPVASAQVANIRRAQANDSAWNKAIDLGSAKAAQADTVLKSVSDRLARAQELTIAGASDSSSPADRATIAHELRNIATEIDDLAETQDSQGGILFAAGSALQFRFGENAVFAPVPSKAEAFSPGGVSYSSILNDAATALESGNRPQIDAALASIKTGIGSAADVAGDLGIRAARIDNLRESHLLRSIDFAAERSVLEDTDLSEAIATLNSKLTTLEAAQLTFGRINRRTLFDILN